MKLSTSCEADGLSGAHQIPPPFVKPECSSPCKESHQQGTIWIQITRRYHSITFLYIFYIIHPSRSRFSKRPLSNRLPTTILYSFPISSMQFTFPGHLILLAVFLLIMRTWIHSNLSPNVYWQANCRCRTYYCLAQFVIWSSAAGSMTKKGCGPAVGSCPVWSADSLNSFNNVKEHLL
jgi:hypothetical protein